MSITNTRFLLERNSRIYVAGHRGLAGSAIWRHLTDSGFTNLVGATSAELDLRERDKVFDFVAEKQPDVIIDAAARVGGIQANKSFPADFLSDNLQIQVNLMDAANAADVDRFLFLGSSCIYPKYAEQPIKESSFLTGALEPTNDAYAIAKITGILQIQASRRQFGRRWISAMPTNLYGPGDNFHSVNSHVLPALVRRIHEAKIAGSKEVALWGSGTPMREFLYIDDLARAVLFLLENYDSAETINVGVGSDLTITAVAQLVADIVGFEGTFVNDVSKPDGTPRKLLDSSRINTLGWRATVSLEEGIALTYQWYQDNVDHLRTN